MVDPATPLSKRCTKCGKVKSLDEFHRDSRQADGRFCWCKLCKRRPATVARQADTESLTARGERRCAACKLPKPLSEYAVNSGSPTGLHHTCRECVAEQARQDSTPLGKRCTKCDLIKPLDQFWRRKDRPDGPGGRTPKCRDCASRTGRRVKPADPDAAEKQCTGCGEVKSVAEFWRRAASFDGLSSRCKDCRSPGYSARRDAPPKDWAAGARVRSARHYRKLRRAVLAHYGKVCACPGCGSTEDLGIDHVHGDGASHRLELTGRKDASVDVWRWLVAQGFPPGFQTLCRRCNSSKLNGPACRLDHEALPEASDAE